MLYCSKVLYVRDEENYTAITGIQEFTLNYTKTRCRITH